MPKIKPFPIPDDYHPNDQIYKAAELRKIPKEFVDGEVPGFIIYFSEKNIRRAGWHRSFLNWIKNGWRFQMEQEVKNRPTHPSANSEWIAEDIKKSDTKLSLKERLRQL